MRISQQISPSSHRSALRAATALAMMLGVTIRCATNEHSTAPGARAVTRDRRRGARSGASVVAFLIAAVIASGCSSPPTPSTAAANIESSTGRAGASTDPTVSATVSGAAPSTAPGTPGAGLLAPTATPTTTATAPTTTAPTTTAPTSTAASPAGPPALPAVVAPAQAGEGEWKVLASLGSGPVVWATTIRPIAGHPEIVAAYAVFDQHRLHAGLFNGRQLPGGGPWVNGPKVTTAAVPALVAAFNGGFLFKHIQGGYFTEGRVLKPLLPGEATLAIDTGGLLTIGVYGADFTNDGTWVSLRQNLPMIVDGGHETVTTAREPGVVRIYWGDNFGGVQLDQRSALCLRTDGMLMYASVGKVDINQLAAALVAAGCVRAMELDINGSWPQFVGFDHPGTPQRVPVALDQRMTNLTRYLTGSTKDFVALFDPASLPAGVVR